MFGTCVYVEEVKYMFTFFHVEGKLWAAIIWRNTNCSISIE